MSSRRSRRTQSGQPKYSGNDYDLDADLEQYNDAPTRRATRSKADKEENTESETRTLDNYANEESDDVEEITRCVCGNDDLVIPKNSNGEFDNVDTGFFIQCEKCAVWQHGYCVGISDEDHAPEKYWCEQCKPEFHTLFFDKFNTRRSKYDPHSSSNHNKKGIKRKNGRVNGKGSDSHQDQLNGHNDSFEGDDDGKKKQRKRYYTTYEEQLKKALEESAKESGVAPEEVRVSSAEGLEGPELRNSSLRKTRNRSGVSDNNESNADDDNDGEEERQDLKEEAEFIKNATQDQKVKLEDKQKIRDLKKMKIKNPTLQANSNKPTDNSATEDTQNNSSKKNNFKKPKKDSKTQVIEDKPFKANIPSARISMNEMNRRIFSIIDFVANTESNLSNEEEFKSNLFKMNDTEMSHEALELKAKLINCYNESVTELDGLTQLLNVWQSDFA